MITVWFQQKALIIISMNAQPQGSQIQEEHMEVLKQKYTST